MKAVLIGNYGVGNVGDEALREYFLQEVRGVEWKVLSAHPQAGEYARLPLGVRSFFTTNWLRTLGAIRSSDAVVFGGGSLFTDVESVRACYLWGFHALVAKFFSKPVILAFQGIGPFRTKAGERIAKWVCRHAVSISVRDHASSQRVEAWGIVCTETFDPIIRLAHEEKCEGCSEDILVFVPRFNSGETFFAACDRVASAHPSVSIEVWLFEPDNPEELRIGEAMGERYKANIRRCETADRTLERLVHVKHLVAQRYHAAIFAFAAACPVTIIEQNVGDKLWELRSVMEGGLTLSVARAAVERGERALREALAMAQ